VAKGTNSKWFFKGEDCPKCGTKHDPTKCAAHKQGPSRGDWGPPCRQPHMRGSAVCRYHGGLTPMGLKGAAQRLEQAAVEEEVRGFLLRLGEPDPVDYLVALEELYLGKLQEVRVLRWAVRQKEVEELTWGVTERSKKDGGYDTGKKRVERAGLSVLLMWMHKAEEQLTAILTLCDRAGMTVKRKEYLDRVGASVAVAMQAYTALLMGQLQQLGVADTIVLQLEAQAPELAHRALLTLDDGQVEPPEARTG
jgi:hypothetical protein